MTAPAAPLAPEDPPGFVVRTEAQKAAADNGSGWNAASSAAGWPSP